MLPYYCFNLIVFVTLATIALFTQRKLRNKKRDSQMFSSFFYNNYLLKPPQMHRQRNKQKYFTLHYSGKVKAEAANPGHKKSV